MPSQSVFDRLYSASTTSSRQKAIAASQKRLHLSNAKSTSFAPSSGVSSAANSRTRCRASNGSGAVGSSNSNRSVRGSTVTTLRGQRTQQLLKPEQQTRTKESSPTLPTPTEITSAPSDEATNKGQNMQQPDNHEHHYEYTGPYRITMTSFYDEKRVGRNNTRSVSQISPNDFDLVQPLLALDQTDDDDAICHARRTLARRIIESLFHKDFFEASSFRKDPKRMRRWDVDPATANAIEVIDCTLLSQTDLFATEGITLSPPSNAKRLVFDEYAKHVADIPVGTTIEAAFLVERQATYDWKDIYAAATSKATVLFLRSEGADVDANLGQLQLHQHRQRPSSKHNCGHEIRVHNYSYYVAG